MSDVKHQIGGRKGKLTKSMRKDRFIECLRASRGSISKACESADVSIVEVRYWMDIHPNFCRDMEDAFESVKDYVEGKALELIDGGNQRMICEWLKAKAPERGWGVGVKKSGGKKSGAPKKSLEDVIIDYHLSEDDKSDERSPGEYVKALPDGQVRN